MDWYYSEGQERKGPVGDEEFHRLVQQGVITNQTLVWNESMPDWKPYSVPNNSPPPLSMAASASSSTVVCAGCRNSFSPDAVVSVAGGMFCAACKPLALQRLQEGAGLSSSAEETRNQYLKHEASIQSVGFLYRLGGVLMTLAAIGSLVAAMTGNGLLEGLLLFAFFLAFGIGQFVVGLGLRRLRPWSRIPAGILSGIGLLGFPVGTIINGYILYLLFGKKGKVVFSPEYALVIEQTPHIKYRTSIVVWVVLGLVLLLIAFGLGFACWGNAETLGLLKSVTGARSGFPTRGGCCFVSKLA